jgi:chromosome segregation ATPase
MDKEEFDQLKSTVKQWLFHTGSLDPTDYANELKLKFIEPRVKRIEELTEWLNEASDGKLKLQMLRADLLSKIGNQEKRIAELEEHIAELKNQVSFLKDNLRVARKDREDLQLDVARGLQEFVKDYPATSLRYLANAKYVEQLTKAKELLEDLIRFQPYIDKEAMFLSIGNEWKTAIYKAEQFLKEADE